MKKITPKYATILFGKILGATTIGSAFWYLVLYSAAYIKGPSFAVFIVPAELIYFYLLLGPSQILYIFFPNLLETLPGAVIAIGQVLFSSIIWTGIFLLVKILKEKLDTLRTS